MRFGPVAITLAVLLVSACDADPFERPRPPGDITLEALKTRSDFFSPPASATAFKFGKYDGFQDHSEFLYFEDTTENIDRFATDLLGFRPERLGYTLERRPVPGDAPWWPNGPVANARGGSAFESDQSNGFREVLIVDQDGRSRIWAFQADPP